MIEKSIALGRKLRARFEKWQKEFDAIQEIRGMGAMLGLELTRGPTRHLQQMRQNNWSAPATKMALSS